MTSYTNERGGRHGVQRISRFSKSTHALRRSPYGGYGANSIPKKQKQKKIAEKVMYVLSFFLVSNTELEA